MSADAKTLGFRMQRLFKFLLIVALSSSVLYPASPAQAAVESKDVGYEKVAFQLLDALQAGQYSEVEAFFQDAHKNKRLTPAGREYMDTIFDRWYDSGYYFTPKLLDHINGWVKQYPKSPFALLARASYSYEQAWKARGFGYADKVKPEQWPIYYAKLAEASKDVNAAFQKDRTIPYAYQLDVRILAQSGEDTLEKAAKQQAAKDLIERAKALPVYDLHGLQRNYMFYALAPRWGGNAEAMLAYAREQAKDAPKNSLAPELIVYAHGELVRSLSYAEKKAYYAQPGVWEETQKAYEHIMAAYPKGAVWAVNYGIAAYEAGYNDKAGELFNRAMQADPDYSGTFSRAGKLYMTPATYAMAEKSYRRYAELRPDDEEPYRQLAYVKIKQTQYQEAIALADQGIKINPQRCILWAHRCLANLKMNQLPQALQDCDQAIKVENQCRVGYLNRSDVYKAMGENEKSAQDYATYKTLKNAE
jgi:Tfp pilus assembly protein PilF